MKILETDRLILRRLLPDDLEDLYALYSDPQVIRYIPDAPRNLEETREELEWFLNGHPRHPQLGLWAAVYKPTGDFIGRCGLLPWTIDGREEVEVAYLFARDYWGQGLGTEVARALVAYGFEQLGFSRLISLVESENLASIRVAEKAGMAFEKVGRDDKGPYWVFAVQKPSSQNVPLTG
ncbi:MAG: GNAT family N-acetyltransferase [Anaerolineales bacterium]